MTLLIAGLIVFLGTHMLRIVAPVWRERTMARLGLAVWRVLVSAGSLAGFALICLGFAQARRSAEVLWTSPFWMRHVAALLVLIAFVLLASHFMPRNSIKAQLHHPVTLAVGVWAFAHLLVNGRNVDAVLFGAFLAWAIGDWLTLRRQDGARRIAHAPGTIRSALLAIIAGVAGWALFAFWLHVRLIGIAPLGWTF